MKTLLLALSFTLSLPAWSMIVSERATLTNWSIDTQSPLVDEDITDGKLVINTLTETLHLDLLLTWKCEDGRVCATVMPEFKKEFKIQTVNYAPCGVREITGTHEDGSLLQIIDRTQSHCTEDQNLDPIVIDLFTKNENGYSQDQFFAESFRVTYDNGIVEGNGTNPRKLEISHRQVMPQLPVSAVR